MFFGICSQRKRLKKMKAFKFLAVLLTALTLGFCNVSCTNDLLDFDSVDWNTQTGITDLKDSGKELSYAFWMSEGNSKLLTTGYYGYDSNGVITSIKIIYECGNAADANELYEVMKNDPDVVGNLTKSGSKITHIVDMSKRGHLTVEDIKAEYRAVKSDLEHFRQ